MSRRFGKPGRRIARRSIAVLVLVGLCALQVPLSLPVPATSSGKDRSAPFPCQDRPCGCSSAARCWNDCCCFTNQQKLDWAAANNVKPPEFVIAAAEKEKAKGNKQEAVAVASCCQKQPAPVPACCQSEKTAAPKAACCQAEQPVSVAKNVKPAACCETKSPEASAENTNDESSIVIGWFAQKCQGKGGPIWSSMPWADGLTERPALPAPTLNEWAQPVSCCITGRVADPPEPPPRLAAC